MLLQELAYFVCISVRFSSPRETRTIIGDPRLPIVQSSEECLPVGGLLARVRVFRHVCFWMIDCTSIHTRTSGGVEIFVRRDPGIFLRCEERRVRGPSLGSSLCVSTTSIQLSRFNRHPACSELHFSPGLGSSTPRPRQKAVSTTAPFQGHTAKQRNAALPPSRTNPCLT